MIPSILIIDADRTTRRVLKTALGGEGYRIWEASTLREGLAALAARAPQAIVLDLALPDDASMAALRAIRDHSDAPVLVLSSRVSSAEQVEALDSGANDFVQKPFREAELLARIRVMLRVAARRQRRDAALTVGPLRLDLRAARVLLHDREVVLTPTEFKLLEILARDAGRVVSHRRLLTQVWGPEYASDVQYLRVFVRRLRRKLEADAGAPELVVTAPRLGYRLRSGAGFTKS